MGLFLVGGGDSVAVKKFKMDSIYIEVRKFENLPGIVSLYQQQ